MMLFGIIIAIIVMVICCIGFKLDTGLFAFAAAAVLILLGAVDEKKAIKGIPWGTLVFICGVGVLINVIDTVDVSLGARKSVFDIFMLIDNGILFVAIVLFRHFMCMRCLE